MSVPKTPSKRLYLCSCGGEALICFEPIGIRESWDGKIRNFKKYYIECQGCGKHTKQYKSKAKAIDVWNRSVRK